MPVAVSTSGALAGKTITAIGAGSNHSVAFGSDGRIYTWGSGGTGQFGDNLATKDSKVPKLVPNTGALAGKTITAISVASSKTLVLCSDGTLIQWGYPKVIAPSSPGSSNSFTSINVPEAVPLGALVGKTITRIAAGASHNLALTADGLVYAWGDGYVGNGGDSIGSINPAAVVTTGVLAGKTVIAIAAGKGASYALTSEGILVAWGSNYNGQIGADADEMASVGTSSPPSPNPAKSPVLVDTKGVLKGTAGTALATLGNSESAYVLAGAAAAPVVAGIAVPADARYGTGAALDFTVTYSSAVTVTGTPSLSLTIGSTARAANYVSGSGTTALLFRYTVQAGETDTDGIALAPTIALNGGTLTGGSGTATLALAPPNLTAVAVDTAAPAPTASLRKSPLAATVTAASVAYRVVFSKAVTGVGAGSFTLTATGTASGTIGTVSVVGTGSYDVTVGSLAGAGTLRLDVKASGSGITDSASNAITTGFATGETYTLVPSVLQPVVSSAATASGTHGTAFSYTVAASNSPASFTATGLPTGLSLDASTGAISGTPTQAGNFTVTLGAINTGGTGTATLALAIAKAPLTVTAANATRAVGTANPNFTVSYAGFVNGETAASLTVAPVGTSQTDLLSAPGTYAIKPTGGSSLNYAFTYVDGTLTVSTVPATLTLGQLSQTYTGTALSPTVTSSPANVPVAFTFDGGTTTPTAAGTYAVVATSTSTSYPGTTNGTFTITKAAQTITLGALPTTLPLKDFVGALQLTATSTSGLPVTLTLDAGSAATLNGSNQLVSIGTTGTVTIRANQAGDGNYLAGTEVVASFNVVKSNQSLAFTQPDNVDFGAAPFALTATATSTLAPAFTVVSGPATVTGSTLTLTGAGTVVVRASQAGDGTFNAAPEVTRTFTSFPTTQSITFADLANATYGAAPITLGATASSSLAVTYAVTSGPATVSGSTLTITGAGIVEITASQAGNANVAAAPDLIQRLLVEPKALTATAQNATRVYGTANPVLTVAYTGFVGTDSASSLLVAAVPSTTAELLSVAGTYSITLLGGSAPNYTITLVTGTLTVTKADQTLAFTAPPAQTYGNSPFTLGAAASSGLTPAYAINSGPATVSGNTVTLTGAGTVSVTASQAGDAIYNAAPGVTQTFTVAAKPLTVAGVTASNRIYDATLAATLATTGATLVGVQSGDTVTLVTTAATGAFATKTVAAGKTVQVSGLTLGGADAAKYTLTQPTTTADITAKALTVSGTTAASRVYDATTVATLTTTASALVGVAGTDAVTLVKTAATGAFANKTVATAKPVTIAGFTLSGADAANYTVTQPTTTADITAKALTVSGVTAANKTYDGITTATLATSGAALVGIVGTDVVTLVATGATGTFANSSAGPAKTVTVNGLTLAGADAANYALTAPSPTATISPAGASIALSNLTHTYDGTAKTVTVNSNLPTGSIAISYAGSPTAPHAAGSYTVTATATDPNYSGTASATLVIAKAAQTVALTAPATATLGTPATISATASSGLAVTLAVNGPATLAGSALTFTAPGTATITATQAGDTNYQAATATATITSAGKLPQTIAFIAPADRLSNSGAFGVAATATSGLPVTFAIVGGPALLGGTTVTLTGAAGTVSIRASQPGNAIYDAAPDILASFSVTAATVNVFFGSVTTGGSTAKSGDVAATLPPNSNQGSLVVVAPGVGVNTVLDFTLNPDGTFTQTIVVDVPAGSTSSIGGREAAAAPVTLTFRGTFAGGRITGTIDPLGLAFSAAVLPVAGPSANAAGLYRSSTLAGTSGSTFSIVGTNNQVLVLAQTPTLTAGALTTLNANGTFSTAAGNATISGTVDAPSTTVSGTITVPGRPDTTFAGLASTTARTDRLVNLSSRVRIGTGANVLITGFVIGGTAAKQVLVRGIGPALAGFGVQGSLANPRLRLFRGAEIVAENDDWSAGADATSLGSAFARVGAFTLPAGSRDAAVLVTLAPGAYTAQVFDSGAAGVALSEIYDASANPNSEYQRLVNISTRGEVTAGEGVLIGGFVVTGNSPKRLLVRGIGPGLTAFGVGAALADPRVRLFRGTELLGENDNWSAAAADAATLAETARNTGAFALAAGSRDAALVVTLAPGAYTAQVTAADSVATGIALVEIYELP